MSGWLLNVTSFFFFVSLASDLFFWLKTWEDRDYNFKRFLLFVSETKKGRSLIFGPIGLIRWVVILTYFLTVFLVGFDNYYHILVFLLYSFVMLGILKSLLERDISLPSITVSNVLIVSATLFVSIVLFIFAPLDRFLWILIIQKMLPLVFSFSLFIVSMFFDFSRDVIINRAVEKIEKHKSLLTIAIIGSYGRGSTKEFISRILSVKYNVLSTKMSYTNSLGIARTILSDLTSKKQIFIAEIDDFKKEDVIQMCALIKPKILVVSGVNSQKLSVFGNMDKLLDSKKEAIKSLTRDGIGIFNGDSDYIGGLIKSTKVKKFVYAADKKINGADIRASSIIESKLSLSFNVSVLGKSYKFSGIKLLGRQNIENLLPGIFIGFYTGIDTILIRKALSELRPLEGTMSPRYGKNKVILIDDTYNANINSVQKVLSYIKLFRGKKILVLEPLLELGKNSKEVHEKLGFEIGKVCDFVFLTNHNYFASVKKGVANSKSKCLVRVSSPSKIIKFVNSSLGREDVVVFEGKESRHSLSGIQTASAL
jgi:UDP-N-acetylmuramoyl-tripeptide--D-alanyl-D-alanine ligase